MIAFVLFTGSRSEEVEGRNERLSVDPDDPEAGMPDEVTSVGAMDVPERWDIETPVDADGSTSVVAETVRAADGVHVSLALT